MIEKIVEQHTENSGMEEMMQEPEQIEVDDDPGPNQETDGREANIEDPFFGFHEERRRSTRIAKMKELKWTNECLVGESWKEITASQKVRKSKLGAGHTRRILITDGK